MDGEITSVSKANTQSESLRTTVPSGVVKHLNITTKDKLDWAIKSEDGELIAKVKVLKRK